MSDKWKNIMIAGDTGSEGGAVLADEEYKGECRITLEKCQRYHAITCGVYGDMVHTAFFGERDAYAKYEEMKKDLQKFIDESIDDSHARCEFYEVFTGKY